MPALPLSLPELFHHQHQLIGCLALQRIDVNDLPHSFTLSRTPADAGNETSTPLNSMSHWFERFVHRTQGMDGHVFVALMGQAYTGATVVHCSAVTADTLCAPEPDNEPAACCVSPFETLLPDAQHALEQRRAALLMDKLFWGNSAFQTLRHEIFTHPQHLRALPSRGYLSHSLAPALTAVCVASARARARVIEYLTAQISLLMNTLNDARPRSTNEQHTLIEFLRTNMTLRGALERASDHQPSSAHAREVETWLGLSA